jgi:hypothetical protein
MSATGDLLARAHEVLLDPDSVERAGDYRLISELTKALEAASRTCEGNTGAGLIAAERQRQVSEEGYTAEHDSAPGHAFDLITAARCYVQVAEYGRTVKPPEYPSGSWPWPDRFWKPSDDISRNLVKAGALVAAALDALAPPTVSDVEIGEQ